MAEDSGNGSGHGADRGVHREFHGIAKLLVAHGEPYVTSEKDS